MLMGTGGETVASFSG